MSRSSATNILPGRRLALGYTITYLSLLVLIPLGALIARSASLDLERFWAIATDPQAVASYRVSFGAAFIAACVNAVFGLLVAWVLVRYPFPGKRFVDALIDLPFALPTAVAGITLTTLTATTGWLGAPLAQIGVKVAFTPLGIVVALIFIGLPFVVRTLQPVIEDIEPEVEEAAATLGASRAQTLWRIVLPHLLPAWMTGFALAFARSVGEFGSVIFIAGNMPYVSEITPLLIISKLEQYDVAAATVLAVVMLVISFLLLLLINLLQWWAATRHSGREPAEAAAPGAAHAGAAA